MTEIVQRQRITELDILRGLAVAIMIIVDAPPADIYDLLKHAAWEGITIADMAFPGFVFAMGISIAISINRRKPSAEKIFKRSMTLFLFGIFMNTLPFVFEYFLWTEFSSADFFSRAVEHGRFFGILQRLALTYLLGMLLIKFLDSDKKIFFAAFVFLILSSAGFHIYATENPFAQEKNIFDALDLALLGGNHLFTPVHDPEGLYGTFSSVAEMLLGFFAGTILLKKISVQEKIKQVILFGVIFFAVGTLWINFDIISKNLWTAPFSLITSGIELFLLAGILKFSKTSAEKFLKPLQSLGKNPLFFYIASNFCLIFFLVLRIENIPAWHWIFQHTLQDFISLKFSSMIFCFIWCGIWIFVADVLDRKNVVIKI